MKIYIEEYNAFSDIDVLEKNDNPYLFTDEEVNAIFEKCINENCRYRGTYTYENIENETIKKFTGIEFCDINIEP